VEKFDIFRDITERTGGSVYIGVVGPVRTGKSTFIKRFMDLLVVPNIKDVHEKERTQDELPQSGAGKQIMTTQPHFVPDEPVTLIFHRDRPGLIARVTHILGDENVNVSQMEVSRKGRGERALMLLATDNPIPARALRSISLVEDVGPIIFLSSLSASTLSCKED